MKKEIPVYDICTLSDFKQEDILISRFAPYLAQHHKLHLAHKHTFYHLVLFTEGAGTHAIDFEQFKVKPYQIYFMVPGQVHSWGFAGKVDGYVINFSTLFFQSFLLKPDYLEQFPFFSGNITDAVINLPQAVQAAVIQLFEQLVNESDNAQRMGVDMVRALLLQLFISIGRLGFEQNVKQPNAYNYTLLKNFQKLIEQHYAELRLPKDYAELLYITPNHLNALCKDVLGIPAGEVIRNRIVLEAKRLLINLELTIAEIAGRLHFDDNSYFTKFFKKHTGITPEEFRKEALKSINHENVKLR
ncbi:helix-turn-helix transcriptional regulator [Mucilaginibacter sp. PAMB04168]|uniref:helix-turn-helix domain-containing protein n=1 Tax=Mucilaginibacter sp. PAMB04168 TaxID=3138567 RepID=UPI0031F65CEC